MRTVIPLAVLFDVSPKDIEIGHDVTLKATLIRTDTNATLAGYQPIVKFFDISSSGAQSMRNETDDGDGKIYYILTYPNDSAAHAFLARIINQILGDMQPQGIVSNPVQLTVANTTKLFLNVTRPDPSSTWHHVFGNASWNGVGVPYRAINVTINQTLYVFRGKTDGNGCFEFNVDLKPVGNAATPYEVLASFEDNVTIATNCTAWSKTPDGQDHAACTTVQYGYKPATKSLTLEVPCLCDRLSLSEA